MSNIEIEKSLSFVQSLPKKKKHHAGVGTKIGFKRSGNEFQGTVVAYRENSVLVEISRTDAERLKLESNITVVNHKNYTVI